MEGAIPVCSICLISLGAFDEPTRLRNCGHAYHKDCIVGWMTKNSICPDCRKPTSRDDLQKDFILCTIIETMKSMKVVFNADGVDIPDARGAGSPPSIPIASNTTNTIPATPNTAPNNVPIPNNIPNSNLPNNTIPNNTIPNNIPNNNIPTNSSINNANTSINNSASDNNMRSVPNISFNVTNNIFNATNAFPNNNNSYRVDAYHNHPLQLSDPRQVYPPTGKWFCDICQASPSLNSPMYHCVQCQSYDMCQACVQRGRDSRVNYTPRHVHPVVLSDPRVIYAKFSGKWHCNLCRRNNLQAMHHCFFCGDFDVCDMCM